MKQSSPIKKVLILATILALPGFLYYLLEQKGKNRYHPLAIYGPKKAAATFHTVRRKRVRDTIYHIVPDFRYRNQDGDTVGLHADTARITIVNFFFTRCPTFCRQMNNEMALFAKAYKDNKMIRLLSISVDPEHDTPEVLRNYAAGYRARAGKWDFLSGNADSVLALAKNGFLVDAFRDTTQAANFIHSPMLILLDSRKRIRGYYDSASREQTEKLNDEIKVLITEELRRVKAGGF